MVRASRGRIVMARPPRVHPGRAFVLYASDACCSAAVSRLFHFAILTLSRLSIAKKAGSGTLLRCHQTLQLLRNVVPR